MVLLGEVVQWRMDNCRADLDHKHRLEHRFIYIRILPARPAFLPNLVFPDRNNRHCDHQHFVHHYVLYNNFSGCLANEVAEARPDGSWNRTGKRFLFRGQPESKGSRILLQSVLTMKKFDEIENDSNRGLLGELWAMLMENKKFWMIPIILTLLLFGILVIIGSSSSAPFIYTLF